MSKSMNALIMVGCLLLVGCGSGKTPNAADKTEHKTPAAAEKTVVPLVPKTELADWCPEHGVPESICTRCNEKLVTGFKEKKDWCEKHNLPMSQCFTCQPELKAKFEAMKPKSAEEK